MNFSLFLSHSLSSFFLYSTLLSHKRGERERKRIERVRERKKKWIQLNWNRRSNPVRMNEWTKSCYSILFNSIISLLNPEEWQKLFSLSLSIKLLHVFFPSSSSFHSFFLHDFLMESKIRRKEMVMIFHPCPGWNNHFQFFLSFFSLPLFSLTRKEREKRKRERMEEKESKNVEKWWNNWTEEKNEIQN